MNSNDTNLWTYFAAIFLGVVVVIFLAYWLFAQPRHDYVPLPTTKSRGNGSSWFARLFESEGEPSIRLVIATVTVAFTLTMVGFKRLEGEQLSTLLFFVDGALLIGSARIVGKAWAARPPVADTQIKAGSAPVTGENVTVSTDANATTTA